MKPLSHFQIRNPKDSETPIEAATQIFASLLPYPYVPLWKRPILKPRKFSFEIYLLSQTIYFYITTPSSADTLVQSLLTSSYPQSLLKKTKDPLDMVLNSKSISEGELVLNSYVYFPIKTYGDFEDIDPLSALVGYLSKQPADLKAGIQILVEPARFAWQDRAVVAAKKISYHQNTQKNINK